jgi:ribosomal protein L29
MIAAVVGTDMELEIFDALRSAGVAEGPARSAVEALDAEFERRDATLASRADIADLRGELKIEIADLRGELKVEIADLRSELKIEIADLRIEVAGLRSEVKIEVASLRSQVADAKSELIRWVAALFTAQIVAIGVLLRLLH